MDREPRYGARADGQRQRNEEQRAVGAREHSGDSNRERADHDREYHHRHETEPKTDGGEQDADDSRRDGETRAAENNEHPTDCDTMHR